MARYTFGKTFKKNGRLVCYRYKDGKKDKLVSASTKLKKKPFRGSARKRTRSPRRSYRSR